MFEDFVAATRDHYNLTGKAELLPLHPPTFFGEEKTYLNECIDSTFISSAGTLVNDFEAQISQYTGTYAIATTNGTSALHTTMLIAGVQPDEEVLMPALTFVACANAVKYCHAQPVFLDSELATGGLCTKDLAFFLDKQTEKKANGLYNKTSGKRIAACIPMHAFGLPMDIHKTIELCDHFGIPVIEDAAESLGSFTAGKHTGSLAKYGALSFNGNKIITCGGGGMCLFQNEQDAKLAKHLTTTAKVPHRWECRHDQIGYNYRMPNINAAIAKAQFKYLDVALKSKRETAEFYRTFFEKRGYQVLQEQKDTTSNYWLNTVVLKDKAERDKFLAFTNDSGVMTRPLWELMSELTPYKNCQHSKLENARWLQERAVNIPSGVRYNITPE